MNRKAYIVMTIGVALALAVMTIKNDIGLRIFFAAYIMFLLTVFYVVEIIAEDK